MSENGNGDARSRKVLTPDQAAELLQLSKSTLLSLTRQKLIPANVISPRVIRFGESELLEWPRRRIDESGK